MEGSALTHINRNQKHKVFPDTIHYSQFTIH